MSDEDLTEDNGEGVLVPEVEKLCKSILRNKVEVAQHEREIAFMQAKVKQAMGANRFLEAGKYTVTWQTQSRKEYTVPAGTTRRFSIKERTDGD